MAGINIAVIFVAICCVQYISADDKAHLPFSKKGFDPKTPTPINIDTSKVKDIITKPLILTVGLAEKVILKNTGKSVEVTLASPFTSTFAFGGVLYNNFYIYHSQKYFFSNKEGGIAATTVDGKGGTQLEASIVYSNIKYGSFENALKYRDGTFEIRSRIIVGDCHENLAFNKFAYYLEQIVNPGSSVEMSIVPTFAFYNLFPEKVQYFAFPGSYINQVSGKQYYSSTTLVKPVLPYRCITQEQFDNSFGKLKNSHGGELDTALSQKPAGDRPIVSTSGIIEIPVPLNLFPSIGGYIHH
ncbi:uncharacterized protein LOC135847983 [Planococcus citri]|uniref:uncharacterized protein LOC135847983 n=1 Tax=Planococcus citri TaxID=170843 RepID=UPI0031F95B2B